MFILAVVFCIDAALCIRYICQSQEGKDIRTAVLMSSGVGKGSGLHLSWCPVIKKYIRTFLPVPFPQRIMIWEPCLPLAHDTRFGTWKTFGTFGE